MVRTLTLEDRRKIELMWRRNASPVKIAAELEISQCTVYTELKRGQETDGAGDVVLDENFRPAYSAERGETVYQRNLRNVNAKQKMLIFAEMECHFSAVSIAVYTSLIHHFTCRLEAR